MIVNEEKKIYDLNTPSNFLSANCDIKSDDLIFAHNNKLKDELMSANIVESLNISKNIIVLSNKEILYFNNLFLNYVKSDLRNINYMENGFISIESTKAFIAIDVNYSLSGNLLNRDAIDNINIRAAVKVFESIKLYNLSGLIIIDFIGRINQKTAYKIRNEFFNMFNKHTKSSIIGPSLNGIYEVTIERKSFDIFYLKKYLTNNN